MPRFFLSCPPDRNQAVITGADARHIARVLRMRVGEPITLCDQQGYDYYGEIARILDDAVLINVTQQVKSVSEPTVQVHLFQAMPKSDKMELIVKRASNSAFLKSPRSLRSAVFPARMPTPWRKKSNATRKLRWKPPSRAGAHVSLSYTRR